MSQDTPKCGKYDLRALEEWLARQAASGRSLTEKWGEFIQAEPEEKCFYIEPMKERGEPPQAVRDSRALMGWEYVCAMEDAFYVWRSTGSTATPPRPRELAGGWADRVLGKKLLWWWLGVLAPFAFVIIVVLIALKTGRNELPWRRLLVEGNGILETVLSYLLAVFCGFWATRREYCDIRRLRRAIREGEHQEPVAQHRAWYETMRWIPLAAAVIVLLMSHFRPGSVTVDMKDHPFLPEETFGGGQEFSPFAERSEALLCDYVVVRQGKDAEHIDHWWLCQTQQDVYKTRLAPLAKALEKELAAHFDMEPADAPAGADETCYRLNGKTQYLLLRRGKTLLFYRTEAPDDLRLHLDDFAALLEAYR